MCDERARDEMVNFDYCLLHRGNLYFEYETLKRTGVLWPCLDLMCKYCFYIFAYYLFVWGNECLKLFLVQNLFLTALTMNLSPIMEPIIKIS